MKQSSVEFQKKYGPWAVIAGASEGLGAEYARQIAGCGINLVLVARRAELLQELASHLERDYRIEVRTLALDLALADSITRIMEAASKLEVGLLVYNAALSLVGPFLDHPIEDHLKEIDINVRAPLMLVHAFGQRMKALGRGGMVLMSSLSALQGSAFISNYAATKSYNLLIAESLWEEWRGSGVDMLVCLAGAIRTPNYLASQPRRAGGIADPSTPPAVVAAEALSALGRRPFVIPGRGNRLASFIMRRILPRQFSIRLMGRILRSMYVR